MSNRAEALKQLMIEVTRVHHHAAGSSRAVAGPEDLTNAQVSLLRSLAADGPSTVPDLARERAIARQPMQRIADEVERLDLVRFAPNPRHKRSKLVALTRAGRSRLARMEARQTAWLERLGEEHSERSIRAASRLLRSLHEELARRALESRRRP